MLFNLFNLVNPLTLNCSKIFSSRYYFDLNSNKVCNSWELNLFKTLKLMRSTLNSKCIIFNCELKNIVNPNINFFPSKSRRLQMLSYDFSDNSTIIFFNCCFILLLTIYFRAAFSNATAGI